jgi:hypothetical protein
VKDKGKGDGFYRFLKHPYPAFPHQGERKSKSDAATCRHFHLLWASVGS